MSFIVQLRLESGRRWRETLGAYGKLTLETARAAAKKMSADDALGIDLYERRAEAEAAAKAAAEAAQAEKLTLRALVERWKREHLTGRRQSYARRAYRVIERNFPQLLEKSAGAVSKREVREALDRTSARSGPAAARFAALTLCGAYGWAVKQDLLSLSPLMNFALPPMTPPRERVLNADEVRRIYAVGCALPYPGGPYVRLLMLTGMRRLEVARLRHDELVLDDEGRRAIELMSGRTKTGAGHRVPLSAAAIRALADCPRVVGCEYVFSSDGRRAINNSDRLKKAVDAGLAAAGAPISDWTFHDFRRALVSTLASETFGYDSLVLDKLLGHAPAKLRGVAAIYQRHDYAATRRRALEDWAAYVTQPPAALVGTRSGETGRQKRA
jgi:integrase